MSSYKKIVYISKITVIGLFCLSMLINTAFAVTVTKGTGGTNISADKAGNATSPAWTTLGNIVLTEGATAAGKKDIAASQTNVTLILSAPASWEFNPGIGTVSYTAGRDITAASISVTSSAATITFTTDSNANMQDVVTIGSLQVRPISGKYPPKLEYIMRTTANPGTALAIAGIVENSTSLADLSMITGVINKLVVSMPGQTFVSGDGATGTPLNQLSGVSFTPIVYATDQFLNLQPSYAGAKTLAWAGPLGTNTYTTAVTFTAGISTTILTTTIRQTQSTALAVRNTGLYGYTGSTFTVSTPYIAIGSPSSQTMTPIMANTTDQIVTLTPSAPGDYFFVNDQKGIDAGYYTTIACTNLVAGSSSITNSHIEISTDGSIDLIAGTANPRVTSDIGTSYQTCNNTLTFIKRNTAANSAVMGEYGQFLNVRVTVPAWQKPGNYSSTITFTLIEN